MKYHSKILNTIHRKDLNERYYQNRITTELDNKLNGDVQLTFKHFLEKINDNILYIKYRGNRIGEIYTENDIIKSIELYNNDSFKNMYKSDLTFIQSFIENKISYN